MNIFIFSRHCLVFMQCPLLLVNVKDYWSMQWHIFFSKTVSLIIFKKWASFCLFSSFQTNVIFIATNVCEKMSIQYTYSARIQTHNLQNMSLLPYLLDHGSRPISLNILTPARVWTSVCLIHFKLLLIRKNCFFCQNLKSV